MIDDADTPASYIETPRGIFTASGIWFHTTEDLLRSYAGPVLNEVPLEDIIGQSESWVRFAQTSCLWLLPISLHVLPVWAAIAGVIFLFVALEIGGPAAAHPGFSKWLAWMQSPGVQGLYYVATLSLLAWQDDLIAMGVGLAGFVLLRWNILTRLAQPVVERVQDALYEMPPSDHILRTLVLRIALRRNLPHPDLEELRQDVLDRFRQSSE